MQLAILLTCHNRKEKTYRCLKSLYKQYDIPSFTTYICDDKSSDGTVDMIKREFPESRIIQGTGDLFWTRGMYKAMQEAYKDVPDLYLMVNDDVEFENNMWHSMLAAYEGSKHNGVVGCVKSKQYGHQTYGGNLFLRTKTNYIVGHMLAPEKGRRVQCDVANWNCFLIDKFVVEKVGMIDPYYEHAMGDFDYSLRMRKSGISIVLADEFIGYCEENSTAGSFRDKNLPTGKRFKLLFKPNGLPVKSWRYFTKKYYGMYGARNFVMPYIKYTLAFLLHKDC